MLASPDSLTHTKTTCPYCGVGCGVVVSTRTREGQAPEIVAVQGDPDHPANYGKLCSKGSSLAQTATVNVYRQVRALQPMMRTDRNQALSTSTWDEALDQTVQRFAQCIEEHGPDSVAFYISGQLLTEDYYVFNKLAKGLIGTNNVDTNSRLCMSSAVSGYKRTLGADAPPCSYDDIELADCVFIAGANPAFAHPILFRRLEAARAAKPGHKMIVVDPRDTDTSQTADLHLKIQPGTDVMLFNAMLHVMVERGWLNNDYIANHTVGFDALRQLLADHTPALAAQVCGVSEADIVTAATWFAGSANTLSLYCQGLNQATTGTDKNTALIALHLATGQIGKPGSGPFSLTGQPNAMGGREVGGLATLLSAHRDLSNPQHRAEIAALWGVKSVPDQPGASALELFERLDTGSIRMVWIACTNPAHSLPNSELVARALKKADWVVLQDAYRTTATAEFADVLLPATTWAEKEGTVTNSERRISRVRAAAPAPGQARDDWAIAVDFAQRLEQELHCRGLSGSRLEPGRTLFPYTCAEAVFAEHRETTRGRDLDITGLTYAMLDEQGPQQWPLPEGQATGVARLYTDGRFPTADGRARFVPNAFAPVAEDADARFPWRLNTGRLRDQWHGASRTGTLNTLFSHEPEPKVAVNPADLARLRVADGGWLTVRSRRGLVIVRAKADAGIAPQQAYLPMHWGPEFFGGRSFFGGVNALTLDAVDPYSRQPELKHAAVHLSPFHATWQLVVCVQSEDWLNAWQRGRALMSQFDTAVCVTTGRDHPTVLFRAACASRPEPAQVQAVLDALGFDNASAMQYTDPASGHVRRVSVQADKTGATPNARITGLCLAGDIQSESWLRRAMDESTNVWPLRAHLLSPVAQPPGVDASPVSMVCNCLGVSQQSIEQHCAKQPAGCHPGERLADLQTALKCGTQCGSCVPQLKRIILATAPASAEPVQTEYNAAV